MKKKRKKKQQIAETHPDLQGLDIKVNEFGEIISNISVDRINDFLDKNVVDKKLDEGKWEEKKQQGVIKPNTGKSQKKK